MGKITTSVGLISGINTGQIIDELMSIESQPVEAPPEPARHHHRPPGSASTISPHSGSLQTTAQALEKTSAFTAATATSSNNNVLTATAAEGAAVGTYQFQVAQLVTTQQMISSGFADATNAKVGSRHHHHRAWRQLSGNTSQTQLSQLNGGAGIASAANSASPTPPATPT